MADRATAIARRARHAGVVAALRSFPGATLDQIIRLVESGKYSDDLDPIQICELDHEPNGSWLDACETDEDAVLRVFREAEGQWLASGYITRRLGLPRWTVQKVCADLVERGLLDRRGETSARRHRYAASATTSPRAVEIEGEA